MDRIVLTLFICTNVQGQVNRNFQLVLNENVPVGQVGHCISTALIIANSADPDEIQQTTKLPFQGFPEYEWFIPHYQMS